MEVYILDSLLRRTTVIDSFESMIWTERYSAFGDFELVIYSTNETRALFVADTWIAINESYRIQMVETVENKTDSDGRSLLTVKGRSLEAILEKRGNRATAITADPQPQKVTLTGTPGAIVRNLFDQICRSNTANPGDNIPFLQPGTLLPPGNIPEPTETITVEVDQGNLYKTMKDICDVFNMGFRLIRNFDKSEIYFAVYMGDDRTTLQNIYPSVIFSPGLDNLADVTEYTAVDNYYNVCYLYSPAGNAICYADNVSPSISGFARKVLPVLASDITYPQRPYALAAAHQTSINTVMNLATTPQEQKDALTALNSKVRLTDDNKTALTALQSSTGPSTGDKANILSATNQSTAYNATEDGIMAPILQQRGKEELAKHKSLVAFDGEIPRFGGYRYQIDFNMGDLLEMRNSDGVTNNMRVTEQIFVSDTEGDRSYPTLSVDMLITPGSWLSWDASEVWDFAGGYWDDK